MKPQVQEALAESDFDNLRLYRGKLSTPDGVIPLKKLGKGMFAEVYREQQPPGRVFAFTDDDVYDKEIAMMAHDDLPENPHVPAVERFGHTPDKTVYTMPFYKAPLKKANGPKAWEDYRGIEKCLAGVKGVRRGNEVLGQVSECVADSDVSPGVGRALESLTHWAANYSDEYSLDLTRGNLATDEAGNLVLLDVLYDREQARKKRDAEQKRRETRERLRRW